MEINEFSSSGLMVRDAPPLSTVPRDPSAGLAFESDTTEPDPEYTWYHTITFPDGEVTPGIYDHRDVVPLYGLADDLSGKRALDVATADGFWAFELERRGAAVTAVDLPSSTDLDMPPQVLALAQAMPPRRRGQRFREAHERLGSTVEYLDRSVYSLDPQDMGQFDLVHAGDLLLHLERPLEALRKMSGMVAPGGKLIISDVVDPSLPGREDLTFSVRYVGGWDTVTWWYPSIDALGQMIVDSGLAKVELRSLYMLPARSTTTGPWRAIMHAHR
jgi:tRNA (mo5U34)-methyltransferase